MLTIAIGVVFVFLVFSLVVSGINELISAVLALRARALWAAITSFSKTTTAGDKPAPQKIAFWKLFSDDHRPKRDVPAEGETGLVAKLREKTQRFDSSDGKARTKNIPAHVFSQAVVELAGAGVDAAASGSAALADIRNAVAGTRLHEPVETAIREAAGDIAEFRRSLEAWFDARMDALSHLYKMWSKWILVFVGLALAFVIDINPITTVNLLRKDAALADVTAAQAEQFLKTHSESSGASACRSTNDNTQADEDAKPFANAQKCYEQVRDAIARTRQLPPPLNFHHPFKTSQETWFEYLFGCLLGGIAIAFGAPFWFDTLRKLMTLRQ